MGVVEVALVFIVEDIVGLLDGLEADLCGFSLGFGNLVRVVGKRGLSHDEISCQS